MKKLILVCTLAAPFALSAVGEDDVKPLTQQQIDQILDQAERDGFKVRSDSSNAFDTRVDDPMVIRPDRFDMFSDTEVFCNETEKLGAGPTIIPLDEQGAPDAAQLPEHCSLKHNTVARDLPGVERRTIRAVPTPVPEEKMKTLSEADTVDEPASDE